VAHGAAPPLAAAAQGDFWSITSLASSAWSTRPEVAAPMLIVAGAYALGWWRLRRRGGSVPLWRVAASAGGLLSLSLALSAPLERLAHASFAVHMAQHLLLTVAGAPLLLLADPFAALVWALPSPVRAGVGRWLRPGARLRRLWYGLTLMSVAWLTHTAAMWLWHLPIAYDAAVADRALHDLEHLAFFGTAVLFWWPVVQPAPRLRPPKGYGAQVVFLVLAALQASLLGLLLTMIPGWYRAYPSAEDQSLGGLIMWGLGGAVDMLAVLVLLGRYLGAQDRPATTPGHDGARARAART
jgi:cytochrome c oxidase assembly factor CtaG